MYQFLDDIATIYYVAIHRFTIKSIMSYWKLGFHHESRLGRSSLPIRDTLANVSGSPAVNPWKAAGPVHTYSFVDWQFLNTRFPVLTDLYPRRLVSNNHTGEKYINVRAGRSLTPP